MDAILPAGIIIGGFMIFNGMSEGNKYIKTVVEVFKTNVEDEHAAHLLMIELSLAFPNSQINFDLEDCDKILRIEGNDFTISAVAEVVQSMQYRCVPLKD